MVKITENDDVVTLINVFTVAPEDQQHLVDVLVDATQAVMRHQQGFISANIHRSLDGTELRHRGVLYRFNWKEGEAVVSIDEKGEGRDLRPPGVG
jgi:hypothetical protein